MGLAAYAFLASSVPGLLAVLFGLGVQATMFGPLKYGILPDHLRDGRTGRRQRPDRGIHVPRHPGRHRRGRRAGRCWSRPAIVGAAGVGCRCVGLAAAFGVPPAPAADRSLADRLEYPARDRRR